MVVGSEWFIEIEMNYLAESRIRAADRTPRGWKLFVIRER